MTLIHLPAAGGLLATLVLLLLVTSRSSGYDNQLGTFLGAILACTVSWICTLIVVLVSVNKVAAVPYPAAIALHILVGILALLGVVGVIDFGKLWWSWPCMIFSLVVLLLTQLSAFGVYPKVLFLTAFYLQCAAAVAAPIGYFVDAAAKAGEAAEFEAKRNEEIYKQESDVLLAIPTDAPVNAYFRFAIGEHARGIPELAAKTVAARPEHEKQLIEALHGPDRFHAMNLLSVEGVPPTQRLAEGVADALIVAAAEVRVIEPGSVDDYRRDTETLTAADVGDRFEPFAATLIPAMKRLEEAAGPLPADRPANVFSGRQLLHSWLRRHKG